jgi:polysaccharide export outer membrane protein
MLIDGCFRAPAWLRRARTLFAVLAMTAMAGCATPGSNAMAPAGMSPATNYLIGPGDNLNIFVWRNPDLSATVPVRPDGRVSIPLVEDIDCFGRTPTQLAREIETRLKVYINDPVVTVIVTGFVGPFTQQVRIVGEASQPHAISYRQDMSVLDAMIAVGGLTPYAAGNRATLIRTENGRQTSFRVRLDDLLKDGDISANVGLAPGDILIIPQTYF